MRQIIKKWLLPPAVYSLIVQGKSKYISFADCKYIDKIKNNKFKNIHSKERCFIIGTGPSIKHQNLTLLNNEYVIGVSGLFQHKDILEINPNYYVLPPVFRGHGEYYDESNFINWLSDMDSSLPEKTTIFLEIGDKKYVDKYGLFKKRDIIWKSYVHWNQDLNINQIDLLQMPSIWSVSESAIQVALYLGFKEIYLLGFDHSWQDDIWKHFDDNDVYMKHFDKVKLEACKEWVDSEHEMTRHAKIFNKYKKLFAIKKNIYNANANYNTYVDTFPKVKFESLFAK